MSVTRVDGGPPMRAHSDVLTAKLLRTAKAVVLVEDARAHQLMEEASVAPSQAADHVAEVALCRAMANATDAMITEVNRIAVLRGRR